MARGLKVQEWVSRADIEGIVRQVGYIEENLGNGYWKIQFVTPERFVDTARSNSLTKLDSELDENQIKHRDEVFSNMAIDTKDWDWLSEISRKTSFQ